jgi:hypothetical protein
MMVSEVRYPSFKSLGLRSTTTFLKVVVARCFLGSLLILREKIIYYVLPIFLYGLSALRLCPSATSPGRGEGKSRKTTKMMPRRTIDMADAFASPSFMAGLAGFSLRLVFASIPVGPINLTIFNEGARRGFALGAVDRPGRGGDGHDLLRHFLHGHGAFFDHGFVQAFMQVMSFVFLLFLGCKFLMAQSVKVATKLDSASEKLEARIGRGFIRTRPSPPAL